MHYFVNVSIYSVFMLVIRVLGRTSHLCGSSTLFKKSISLRSNSTWERFKDFVFASEKENFHTDFIKRSHAWDRVNRAEWKLIYRDIGASRSFFMVSTLLPLTFVSVCAIVWDVSTNKEADRMDLVRRLQRDANELGVLVYFPCVAICLVVLLILRVQHCRLLRIYQHRHNVDQFIAIASRTVVGQKQVLFDRNVASAFYYGEDQSDLMQIVLNFLFGNMQIGRSKYLVMDDCFRANNFRSYMLNETSCPPRMETRKL